MPISLYLFASAKNDHRLRWWPAGEFFPCQGIVTVYDGDLSGFTGKDGKFCLSVIFHGLMIIKVIATEIGKYRNIEQAGANPVLGERMRRYFHGDIVYFLPDKICQQLM